MSWETIESAIRDKMKEAPETIPAFLASAKRVFEGDTGLLSESSIEPAQGLPRFEDLDEPAPADHALFESLVVIKLNGGLGTGMGLEKAKSLLPVKGEDTFLDFIARQITHLRRGTGGHTPAFYLMDSFSTQKDSLDYLKGRYPDLPDQDGILDFLQSRVPKLLADTLEPVDWTTHPELEWCPPGHGDLYPSILNSGLLDRLIERGIRYAFVSNSDNLGATMDLRLLKYFAQSELSFLMEAVERTAVDRKGGHLARRLSDGRLVLRESAQCPEEDLEAFQDIEKHPYFNSNNLWVRLDHLKEALDQFGGALPLPLIRNTKTVDPKDGATPKVLQLETAMGAAIECFANTGAVVIPRSRFAPVKTSADWLSIQSDAYEATPDHRVVLAPARRGVPPVIRLDSERYKRVDQLRDAIPHGAPSLIGLDTLEIHGPAIFEEGVILEGSIRIENSSDAPLTIPAGAYRDHTFAAS